MKALKLLSFRRCNLPLVKNLIHSKFSSLNSVPESYFVTTPIYYVNGAPHLGHAYTSVSADVLARFHRKDGKQVYFVTGTDEHGQKVQQSAAKAEKSPLAFANENSDKFRVMTKALHCSNDDFIRTTEQRHKDAVLELWNRLQSRGQIYLGSYEGWYSVRDEAFYSESELVNGKAPTGADVEWVKEESYFFRLSNWTTKLLEFYDKHPDFLGPDGRRNEVISFVSQEGGLRDLSVSRTTFTWGISVPNDPKHVIYVWLDALVNYLSVLGFPDDNSELFKRYWPANLHVVGKDILRFHTVFWPAFLLAAELEPPKKIFAHGWWTINGEKMSKSVGNVLDPFELIEKYGVDYLRYFLISEIPFGNDGDFSHQSFVTKINSNLANDFGNLAQRVLVMIQKNCDAKVPKPGPFTQEDILLLQHSQDALLQMREHFSTQSLSKACEVAIGLARAGNKYIDVQAPWTLRKTDFPRMETVLYVLVEVLRKIAILLEPVMPTTCTVLLDQMGVPDDMRSFESMTSNIEPGGTIRQPKPIFPKLE